MLSISIIVENIIKWIIPVVCTGLLTCVQKELKQNKENNVAMKDSMIILLRSQIVSKCEKYEELGYLPDYARSCICDLFKQYKALGGNHGVEVLVNETLRLKAKQSEQEEKTMKKQLEKLIDVKSLITLILTVLFFLLAVMGVIDANAVLTIYTTVIAFYFGTQYQKNQTKSDEKEEQFMEEDINIDELTFETELEGVEE